MTVQQQQSKQEQTTPASKTSTTTTPSTSKSVVNDHQSSATRAANDNRAKMIPDKNNSNRSTESNKRPVDNFLTWLTSPLDIDVTGQANNNNKTDNTITANKQSQRLKQPSNNSKTQPIKQQSSSQQKKQQQNRVQPQTPSPKNNATKTVEHLPVEKQQQQQKDKTRTYHEQKMMQQNNTDKQQNNKDGTDNNEHDQNPAEQFLNWLTSPPDLGSSGQDPLSMTAHPNKQKKHASPSKPQPSNVNKPPQQQKRESKQTHQSNTKRVVHHKNQPKQFGAKIIVSKPDVSRSKSILLEINLDPHPELPSHVPTPDTIDDIDEPWTSKVEGAIDNALGGIHHHFSNIFDNQGKSNNSIKYAPSFDTPPQSPVSSGKKSIESELILTPPSSSTKTTKWGPEIWNAKMSSPTNSLTMMPPPSMSTTSLMSIATTANNNGTSISSINSIVVDGELLNIESSELALLNIEFSELANQEKLLRQAMERKQKREQKQNEATKKITATTADKVDGSGGNRSSSSSRHNNPSSSSSDLNKKKIKKEQPRDAISSSSGKKNTNETSNATQNEKTISSAAQSSPTSVTTQLQLRWMYENALNLQASCPRRGSIRRCDGEDLNYYSSSLYTPILTVDEKENLSSSMMKEQQKHHPQQQQQQQKHNNVVILKMSTPALESLNAIAAE